MPRPLKFGRAKQSSENQKANESRTNLPSPMFTGAVIPEAVEFSDNDLAFPTSTKALRSERAELPRTIECARPRFLPSPAFTGAPTAGAVESSSYHVPSPRFTGNQTPEATELPRTLEIGGFLYQRVDVNHEEDVTRSMNGYQGGPSPASMPLIHKHQDRLRHLDRGYSDSWTSSDVQFDNRSARHDSQQANHGSYTQSNLEQDLSQAQQNIDSNLFAARVEVTGVSQNSRTLSTSQALSLGSESVNVRLPGARSAQQAVPKPERKSYMLRELEPHESPEPESEPEPETLQPTTTDPSQSALPRLKRKTKMLRELKGYNKSPEPESDSEQEHIRSRTARSSKSTSLSQRRKSMMLREIEAYNQSPEPESEPEIETLCNLKDDLRDAPLTRSAHKDLENFVRGKPPTPRKNLNLKALMLAQFSGVDKATKTFYAEDTSDLGPSSYQGQQDLRMETDVLDEEEDEEENLPKKIKTNGRSDSQPVPTRGTMARQVKNSTENRQQNQKLAAESAWLKWDKQKGLKGTGRINQIVMSPRYNPRPSQQELGAQGRKKPAYHATAEIPESFEDAFYIENGLYIFTPTAAAFSDFGRFLKDIEEIAGRTVGVVKVIVPSECLSRTPSPSRSQLRRSPVTKTIEANMTLDNDDEEDPSKVYNILTTNGSTSFEADEWLDLIQRDKDRIIKKRAISAEVVSCIDVWKENHVLKPYTERRMIRYSKKQNGAVTCALNEPATPILRAALKCKDPNIENFLGNRFASSRSTQPGINKSVFHIAGGPGPLSPLQMNKYAAYSLNYHHSGAPRILTVTLPEHHAKLEKFLYVTQNSGGLFGRPRKPPLCSQFVAHQPVYVPHATLSLYEVEYTEVDQHEGEMVITFPYAYHQAFTSGPNITEEILYASDRCKVFHREKIYQHCNPKCGAKQPDVFDLEAVFSNTLSGPRSGHGHRSGLESPSLFLSPRQSPEASASREGDANDSLSGRISGLKAMDRVSDDGDWTNPSAQASRLHPVTHQKATRMTSNPFEPDIWDPAHAFEDSHTPADDDDGSSIGGIRPRDVVTGRLLMPHELRMSKRKRGDESDEAPRKHSHRH